MAAGRRQGLGYPQRGGRNWRKTALTSLLVKVCAKNSLLPFNHSLFIILCQPARRAWRRPPA